MAKKKNQGFMFHKELTQQLVTLSTSAFGLTVLITYQLSRLASRWGIKK